MTIFNSLGSNYNFPFALKTLLPHIGHHHLVLREFLEMKYGGETILFHKGREALELALKIVQKIDNLPPASLVAINGFTCYAVYRAIVEAGYRPFYLDIDEQSLNFSPEKLRSAIEANPHIKVVVVQNTLGYPCAVEQISRICAEKGVILIEDLAHSAGTIYSNGKEAGTFGDFVVFSFSQDKIIDSVSGGALVIRNPRYRIRAPYPLNDLNYQRQLIERLYPLFTFVTRKTYGIGLGRAIHAFLKKFHLLSRPMGGLDSGILYHLPSWYCYLAKFRLDNLSSLLAHRRSIASVYAAKLDKSVLASFSRAQLSLANNLRFPILVNNRGKLIQHLEKNKVFISDIWYEAPVSPQKYLNLTNYQPGQCPEAEKVASRILNLPTHINLSEKEAGRIAELVNQWLQQEAGIRKQDDRYATD